MFRDWVWGEGKLSFGLSEPADVGVSCDDNFVCTYNSAVEASGSRTPRHSATHRIPRGEIQRIIEQAPRAPGRNQADPVISFLLRVLRTPNAKLSPVTLAYPLARCHLHSLGANDSPIIGQSLTRPTRARLTFSGRVAPTPAGDGTLWVSAEIQHHQQHVRDPLGVPEQNPRVLRTTTGEFYDTALFRDRDPQAEYLPTHHNLPALSAIAVHVGDMGELVDRLFLDDYRQYAPPFVDSITVPKRLLEQLEFAQTKQVDFTLDIPPGIGSVRIKSAVIAYPIA